MIKQLKYEFMHRRRLLAPAYGMFIILQLLFFLTAEVFYKGMFWSSVTAVALSSVVFSGLNVIFVISIVFSATRDFHAKTKFLVFSIPQDGKNYIISRYIALTAEIILYLAVGLLPFVLLAIHYTSNIVSFSIMETARDVMQDTEFYFDRTQIITTSLMGLLMYTQLFIAVYFSKFAAMKKFNKSFKRFLFAAIVFILYFYIFSLLELIPMWLSGSSVQREFGFLINVNMDFSSIPQMITFSLMKITEIAATYIMTVKLINKPINLN